MWKEKFNINNQLLTAIEDAGYDIPNELQNKTLKRIIGGQDLVAIGSHGSGKTTTIILSIIMRLKYALEEAPRAIVLVQDREQVELFVEQFKLLGKNTNLRVLGVYSGVGTEAQMDGLADGTDVLVGTPDRIRALYLKLGVNLNKMVMFVLDDAEMLIKLGAQLPISELFRSLPKCQQLVFTELIHEKVSRIIDPFLNYPHVIEVDTVVENNNLESYPQVLYHLPNFRTKLNLLHLITGDKPVYKKVIVFVNTPGTAEKVFSSLKQRGSKEAALYKAQHFDQEGCQSIEEFMEDADLRLLVATNDVSLPIEILEVPTIVHFDLPLEVPKFMERIENRMNEENYKPEFVVFATDLELGIVKRIEQATGKKMLLLELPQDLKVEVDTLRISPENKKEDLKKKESEGEIPGSAFHEKKESNTKEYNYGYKDKQKMAGKKSKRRNS